MNTNPYESPSLVAQYLLFHYGTAQQQLPHGDVPSSGLHFPVRCVTECLDIDRLARRERALDLGCSVGRSAFELAKFFEEVVAVDYSRAFITAARRIQRQRSITCQVPMEGVLTQEMEFHLSPELPSEKVHFVQGDALDPNPLWGVFDCVLAANLLDRVFEPACLLQILTRLTRPGGQLILASPYTWLEEFTPRQKWPTGLTFDFIQMHLSPHFTLHQKKEMPFTIREHARKFQWSYAEATVWIKK